MNFKSMCEGYIDMRKSVPYVMARRRVWPPIVHLILGAMENGSPKAVVMYDADGTQHHEYMEFGMSLILNGKPAVYGWCPSIDDVMGQDWELIKGR